MIRIRRAAAASLSLLAVFSSAQPPRASAQPARAGSQVVVMASTTSTEQSGLFAHLLPAFAAETGIEVRVVAQGTGQALETARRGDADLVFVHDRAAEEMTRLRARPITLSATGYEAKQKRFHNEDVRNQDEEIELHAPAVAADDPAQATDERCREQADNHHAFGIPENQPEERDQNEKAELRNAYP